MSKVSNALKAVAIVGGFCLTAVLAALIVAMFNVAKGAALVLLAILLAVAALLAAIYLVYRYLEAK